MGFPPGISHEKDEGLPPKSLEKSPMALGCLSGCFRLECGPGAGAARGGEGREEGADGEDACALP